MTLTIKLPPALDRCLQEEAARRGQAPEEYAQAAIEEKLSAVSAAAQRERNRAAIALLDEWRAEPPDLEEAEGYPLEITPLSLREVSIE